jgi:hypothetical protein
MLALVVGDFGPKRLGGALDLFSVHRDAGKFGEQLTASSKLTIAPTLATMRVTAGDRHVFSSPSSRSRGQNPCPQEAQ